MAKLYRKNAAGQIVKLENGNILTDDDCACCEGCDCLTGGPTADFSYEQTDDIPCTFNFTDESIAGECGEIVEWLWDFGDGTTSTTQNPSHTYADNAYFEWDVTLTVTDSSGCEDSVIGTVKCFQDCDCGFNLPETVQVTLPDFPDTGGFCGCEDISEQTLVLFRFDDAGTALCAGTEQCQYCLSNVCGAGPNDYWRVLVTIISDTQLQVTVGHGPTVSTVAVWELTGTGLCTPGLHTLPFVGIFFGTAVCTMTDISVVGDVTLVF